MTNEIAPSNTALLAALIATLCLAATPLAGQLAIDTVAAPVSVDFNDYAGLGFSPAPVPGQLDSTVFSVAGLSEGDLPFGTTAEAGDFARGMTSGGVSTGGVYAFDLGDGNAALGVQPTTSDYSPGALVLRVRNDTGIALDQIVVAYDVVVFNDQNRGSSWNLGFSRDELGPFDDVSAADFASPAEADSSPAYVVTPRSAELLPVPPIAPGELFYLRWTSDDAAGTGSRDEIGIDDISIVGLSLTPDPNRLFGDQFESGDLSAWSDWQP